MNFRNVIFILMLTFPSTALMAGNSNQPITSQTETFTAESLKQFDPAGLSELVKSRLKRAAMEIPAAANLVVPGNTATEALEKRLEIARELELITRNYMTTGGKENLIFAWQGAEELRVLLDYFIEEAKRLENLRQFPAPKIISVREFGAKGDGKTDDGPAIQHALDAAAMLNSPVTVKIPAGTYIIGNHHGDDPPRYNIKDPLPDGAYPRQHVAPKAVHLLLKNVKNLKIEGEKGTKLRFSDPVAIAIRVLGSENVTLKDFSIDYINLPFTQGTIVAVDNGIGALTFKVDPGYPSPTDEYFVKAPSRRLTPHDSAGRYCLNTYRLGKVEKTDSDTFKIYPFIMKPGTSMWNPKEVGFKANIIARYDPFKYDAYAVDLRLCKFCRIEGVTVHSSPAGGFRTMLNYAVSLVDCRVEVPENSGRVTSTNADGCQSNGLIAAFIKNCAFLNSEDDGININSSTYPVEEISADRKNLKPEVNGGALFVDSITGQVHAIARLGYGRSAVPLPELIRTRQHVDWDKLSHQEKSAMGYWSGTNEKFKLRPDRIISIPPVSTGGVITGCEFRNIRGLGIQVTAPNTLIENCTFSGNSGSAININAMVGWGMVFNTHNVTVRNCKFSDYRRDAISCRYHPVGDKMLEPRLFSHLRFIDNVFIQDKATSIQICNCSGVTVSGNKFYKTQSSPWVIDSKNSTGITGCDNSFLFPRASVNNSFRPSSLATLFKNNSFICTEYHK